MEQQPNLNKYQNGKIYKITDNTNGNIYYGSTQKSLARRLSDHKYDYKRREKEGNVRTSSQIICNQDYTMDLVEDFPCSTRKELEKRESYYINNYECINKAKKKQCFKVINKQTTITFN
mgnify:CR=1 FL=1